MWSLQDLRARWKRFAAAKKNIPRTELSALFKLTEMVKWFLYQVACAFVRAHRTEPLLFSYESDGTPATTVFRTSLKVLLAGGKTRSLARRGERHAEYLVQRIYICAAPSGHSRSSVTLLEDPLPMNFGKDHWAVLPARVKVRNPHRDSMKKVWLAQVRRHIEKHNQPL